MVTDGQAEHRTPYEVTFAQGGSRGRRRVLVRREPDRSEGGPRLDNLRRQPVPVRSVQWPPVVTSGTHQPANGLPAVDQLTLQGPQADTGHLEETHAQMEGEAVLPVAHHGRCIDTLVASDAAE